MIKTMHQKQSKHRYYESLFTAECFLSLFILRVLFALLSLTQTIHLYAMKTASHDKYF